MLNIIRGRAGSGKTEFLFNLIEAHLNCGEEKPLFLVPEQFSFVTERELLVRFGAKRAKNVEVTSFSRLARTEFQKIPTNKKTPADDGIRAVLMKKALTAAEGRLNIFGNFKNTPSSLKSLIEFHKELDLCLSGREGVEEFVKNAPDGLLKEKLSELLTINTLYEAIFAQSNFDDTNALKYFNEISRENSFFKGRTVFVDSFRSFSKPELDCIAIASVCAKDIYVTLCTENEPAADGPFSFMTDFENRIIAASKELGAALGRPLLIEGDRYSGDISYIEKNIYTNTEKSTSSRDSSVKILECGDKTSECRAVASEIKKLLRSGKYRCRDIVIIERTAGSYKRELINTLLEYGIPVFNDSKRPLSSELLFVFSKAVLDCLTDSFSQENIMRYIKSALSPLSFGESAALEKYALVWDIGKNGWVSDFKMDPRGFGNAPTEKSQKELQELNGYRKRAIIPLLNLKNACENTNGDSISREFFNFLSKLNVPERLFDLSLSLENEGLVQEAARLKESFEQLIGILDDLSKLCGNENIDLKQWYEYFDTLVFCRETGEIPQGIDEVTVGSADRIRTSGIKAAFLVGVNRDEFPLVSVQNGLLTERDRCVLYENGILLKPPFEYAAKEERFIVYCALTAGSEKLFLSYKTQSESGETDASPLIAEIKELLPGVECVAFEKLSPEERIESEASAFRELAALYPVNSCERETLLEYFSLKPEYRGKLLSVNRLVSHAPYKIENTELSTSLFKKDIRISASKVEEYYKCPFKYFCRYGLDLKPLEAAEFDPRQSGTLVHLLLENVLKTYGSEGLKSASDKKLREFSSKILQKYIEEKLGGKADKSKRFMFLYERLIDTVSAILDRLKNEFSSSAFKPVDFELGIGSDIPSYKLPLENGTAEIIGSVDRVDLMEKDGLKYARVIDYKTGKKKFELAQLFGGLNIQMMLYLSAILKTGTERYGSVIPAGVLYLPSRIGIDSYLSRRSPSSEAVAAQKRNSGKLSGMILESPVVLNGMGAEENPDYLPAKYKKDGAVGGSCYSLSQFKTLEGIIEREIKAMGDNLHNGNVEALPSSYKASVPCSYCDYKSVCGREEGDSVREISALTHTEALKYLDKTGGDENEVDSGTK